MGLLHLVEHVQQSQAESMSWLRGHKTGLALAQWARCLAQQNQTRAENQLLGFLADHSRQYGLLEHVSVWSTCKLVVCCS